MKLYCRDPRSSHFGLPTCQTPLSNICSKHSVEWHLYADDIQMYISFDPSHGATAVVTLEKCFPEVGSLPVGCLTIF